MRTILILFLIIYFIGSYGSVADNLKENVINKITLDGEEKLFKDYFLNDYFDNKNNKVIDDENDKVIDDEEIISNEELYPEPDSYSNNFDPSSEFNNQNKTTTDKSSTENENDFYQENIVKFDENLLMEMVKDNLNKISMEDKVEITAIVLNNFSLAELNEWRVKAIDGLTSEEKEELKSFVYERISEEEITNLKQLALKYAEQISEDDLNKIKALVKDN